MRHLPSRRVSAWLAAAALAGGGVTALAAATATDTAATVAAPAERQRPVLGDTVAVYDVGAVDQTVVDLVAQVADATGAQWTTGRTGSLGMRRVVRAGQPIHAAPDGFVIPVVYVAFPETAMGWLLGFDVAAAAADASGPLRVGLNERGAALTGAAAGDVIEIETRTGTVVRVEVAAIVPASILGGSELVMSTSAADRLGEPPDTRAVIWGFDSRAELDAAITASGLEQRSNTGVARSWDPLEPDSTLGTLSMKERLGPPWFQVGEGSAVTMHPTWRAQNLTNGRVLLNETIPISARCHVRVVDALRAALADVAAAGLTGAIDVVNANTYGGCYAPRFSRGSWFLSRHAWGTALDINTVANCQGCVPQMDCDVVRIFRRHGFAWGGNFAYPDGMHFEWVGERRDQIAFDSTYCDNIVAPAGADVPAGDGRVVAATVSAAANPDLRGVGVLTAALGDPHGEHGH